MSRLSENHVRVGLKSNGPAQWLTSLAVEKVAARPFFRWQRCCLLSLTERVVLASPGTRKARAQQGVQHTEWSEPSGEWSKPLAASSSKNAKVPGHVQSGVERMPKYRQDCEYCEYIMCSTLYGVLCSSVSIVLTAIAMSHGLQIKMSWAFPRCAMRCVAYRRAVPALKTVCTNRIH